MKSLTELVAGVLELPEAEVDDGLGPATHDAWTSVRHLQLVMALEDRYGVAFTRDEIRAIRSVGDARAVLSAKGVRP